jgi:cyclic pyranopterin phosphate synthase
MEALTACAVAALSVVSSLLDLDPTAHIQDLVLLRKTGGKSGDWGRLMNDSA